MSGREAIDTHHEPVAGFLVDDRHVCPVEQLNKFHHRLCLVLVGRDCSGEERIALHGAESRTRREETHLNTENNVVVRRFVQWKLPPVLYAFQMES